MNSTVSARLNADLLDEKYEQWKTDPKSVEPTWAAFFEGFELGTTQPRKAGDSDEVPGPATDGPGFEHEASFRARIVGMVYAFRSLGHTAAWLNPLSDGPPHQPALDPGELGFTKEDLEKEVATTFFLGGRPMKLREMMELLRTTYCDRIGFEFMHIHNMEVRNWIRDRIESRGKFSHPDLKKRAYALLAESEAFEAFLHKRFIGEKRFSVEGGESLLVALDTLLQTAPELGIKEIVMGMAHRGRLNVLANFMKKPLPEMFYEFSKNYVHRSAIGDGDVKYHLGYENVRRTVSGEDVAILLSANPSHLEAVNPVVEGKARARQRILGDTEERKMVLPVLLHGDAAFAGQGSVAEVLNLSQLPGYRTGGTVHIVVNNQIGFTTMPEDARSSAYATDVAKIIEAPIFHVNGDHPMELMFAVDLALRFRQQFSRDVVIDLYCYRRHGHNEADLAAFTQPKISKRIQNKETAATIFQERLVSEGVMEEKEFDAIRARIYNDFEAAYKLAKKKEDSPNDEFEGFRLCPQPPYDHAPVPTGISSQRLQAIGRKLTEVPDGFRVHPTLAKRFIPRRAKALEKGGKIDWAFGEALAFGSLLVEGTDVRLSGQDSKRGTFSQRHLVYYDTVTRERYVPLLHLSEDQARLCAYNSSLSEAAVLGFDYGYSLAVPDMLIMWEAQFGDFANGAQVIIDQFISSAESKWLRSSGVVMLLPHGYEGMGPEHSSARPERFLQLCAENNMQVCNPTTPAQYFHLLRRQMRRPFLKPLIVMTPKSLLTHPEAVSSARELSGKTSFREFLDDPALTSEKREKVNRLIFCSGKVYYDLVKYREEREIKNAAIIRVEQLYPFHWDMLEQIHNEYPNAANKWVWCQEEPLNMGAWSFIGPRLQKFARKRVRYAGRERSASPATGSKAIHVRQQQKLVRDAFSV